MIELTDQEKADLVRWAKYPFFTGEKNEREGSILDIAIADHIEANKPRPLFRTYLIEDTQSGLFKIGRAKDVDRRFNEIRSHNAFAKLVWSYPVDIERPLHVVFSSRKFFREWFKLEKTDVRNIKHIT